MWDELENEFHLRQRSLTGTQYSCIRQREFHKEKDKIGTKDKNARVKLAYEEVIQNDVTMTLLKL